MMEEKYRPLCAFIMMHATMSENDHEALVTLRDVQNSTVGAERSHDATVYAYKQKANEHNLPRDLQIGDYVLRGLHEALS